MAGAGTIQSGLTPRARQALEPVFAAVRSGNVAEARRLAQTALEAGIEHPLLLNLRALDHEDAGRFDAALSDLRRAHVLAPKDFAILNACGLCLGRLDRLDEALACFDQVLAMRDDFGPGWFNRGWALERLGDRAGAADSYARSAALNPQNAQAWANMAFLAIRRGDEAAARSHADKALEAQPGHPTALLVLADIELKDPPVAEARLRALLGGTLSVFDRALALGQLGDALDAQDRAAEAFDAYSQSNSLFREEARPRFEAPGRATVPETLAWLNAWAERRPPGLQAPSPTPPARRPAHVFLLGFPRSGTTLIESALAAHPDVVSLEERDTLHAGVLDFLRDAGGLDHLESLPDSALRPYREDYWAQVKRYGVEADGRIFIDKNPFNTLKLPLIQRLFPDARVIFSVRDPRDVVLSCFRRRFNLNPSTYEFLDLERTAANYDGAMRLAESLRRTRPCLEHRLIYERLVEDFAGQARAVCDFIGAGWRDDLVDFSARARRGDVASASAQQIARGLFSDGAGQWRRYKDQLAPVLDTLAPWVERFGYSPD